MSQSVKQMSQNERDPLSLNTHPRGTMELLDDWAVGPLDGWTVEWLDNLYLSVNSVKSEKPSQTFYIRMISSLFHS